MTDEGVPVWMYALAIHEGDREVYQWRHEDGRWETFTDEEQSKLTAGNDARGSARESKVVLSAGREVRMTESWMVLVLVATPDQPRTQRAVRLQAESIGGVPDPLEAYVQAHPPRSLGNTSTLLKEVTEVLIPAAETPAVDSDGPFRLWERCAVLFEGESLPPPVLLTPLVDLTIALVNAHRAVESQRDRRGCSRE